MLSLSDRTLRFIAGVAFVLVLWGVLPRASAEDDRHIGYYYPAPATTETYRARTQALSETDRTRRIAFVTQLSNGMLNNDYAPPFAVFAKGEFAQKLIITSLYDGAYDTLYRMRGLLAILSSRARDTELFRQLNVQDVFTFLDLLKLLGFEQVTVTDGDDFAHQIRIE